KSNSKLNAFAHPRQIAMFIASKHTNFTSTEIGTVFGKAHSTVIRSSRKIEDKLPQDINLKKQIDKIILELADARR
ncbi:MAG: helix-turn-helix domain-containing protein, partial [Brevinema sp.]